MSELHAAYFELMCELVGGIFGLGAERTVSDDDLREHRFDSVARAPDPLDYW